MTIGTAYLEVSGEYVAVIEQPVLFDPMFYDDDYTATPIVLDGDRIEVRA